MSIVKKIKELKLPCEANIVICLLKSPDLFYEYEKLTIKDFHFNEWKVFFTIGKEITVKEKKQVIDDITVNFYLEKHEKLRTKYDEYGGWNTIENAKQYVNTENIEGYVQELNKWNAILELHKRGFPVDKNFKAFQDMDLEEIYQFYEIQLNDTFINSDTKIKSHNLCEGFDDLIEELDKAKDIGFPIKSPMLNDIIGGNMLGNVTILGGLSGAGKTTITLELVVASILEQNEQCVIALNEQDQLKLKKEMLAWTVNNVMDYSFNKKRLRQGGFTPEEKQVLKCAGKWLEEKKDNRNVTIIPLQNYSVELMKKIINKYSALGVKYFILDTFKASDNSNSDMVWLNMMADMRKLYDLVKPANKNVHLWCTLQLKKDKIGSRYLTMDNIGMSKNVIDVCSTALLMRGIRDDEKQGGKNELRVYSLTGKNNGTKIPVTLDSNKFYCIIFITKNREGESGQFQIVAEHDLSRNIYKEIGITFCPEDF